MTLHDIYRHIERFGLISDMYYSYPTGTVASSYIAESEDPDDKLSLTVEHVLQKASEHLGVANDNKTAVRCYVSDQPIYLCRYDFKWIICTEIDLKRGAKAFELK